MIKCLVTVAGDYFNTTKTTFDFNFDLYQAVKQQEARIHINIEVKR